MIIRKRFLVVCCTLGVLALSGCNDDNNTSNSKQPNPSPAPIVKYADLTGTAAIGEAIKDANVTASCKDGTGFKQAVKTAENGTWSGQVDETKFPCALQVKSGEQSYHSYATKAGNVNITPFTDLAIALATTQTPETWFKTTSPVITETQLKKAVTDLTTQLKANGYSFPAEFDLLASKFEIGDTFDKALDTFGDALAQNSHTIKNHAALVDLIKGGNIAQISNVINSNPNPTSSCAGNTNPWGCIDISGSAAPQAYFEQKGFSAVVNGALGCDTQPKATLQVSNGAIDYSRFSTTNCVSAANSWYDTLNITYQTVNGEKKHSVTYIHYKLGDQGQPIEMQTFSCSEMDVTRPCSGLILDAAGQKVTFSNTKIVSIAALSSTGKAETISLNGTMKFTAALPEPVKSTYGSMTITGLQSEAVTFEHKGSQFAQPTVQTANGVFVGTWNQQTPQAGTNYPYVRQLDVNKGGMTSISFRDHDTNKSLSSYDLYSCQIVPTGSILTTNRPCTGQLTIDESKKTVTLKDMALTDGKKSITLNGTMTY